MKHTMKKILALLCVSTLALSMSACSSSEASFPEKQVTIIMPWSVGGGPDVIARQVASYGEEILGVPVIVENVNGGSGTIAMNETLAAADDGYTMVVSNGPLFSLTPGFVDVTYTIDDFSPLIGMRQVEFVVLTNPGSSGLETLEDVIAYGQAGNTIKFATTGGPGGDSYTMISVLFEELGLPAEAVVYDGGQEAINALVGGHVEVSIGSPPVYRDYVTNGDLAVLGTFIPEGIDVEGIGHIPSFNSLGVDVEFVGMDYFAVLSSVGDEEKAILTDFIEQVYADADFQAFMETQGMAAWDGKEDEIVSIIDGQTIDMQKYIDMLS